MSIGSRDDMVLAHQICVFSFYFNVNRAGILVRYIALGF